MSDLMDETIVKMVKTFKSSGRSDMFTFNSFNTPLKRSFSTESNQSSADSPATLTKKPKSTSHVPDDILYVGSPREVRRIRANLIDARHTILNLENRITHMHGVRKQMQLMFDTETQSLKKQREYDRKSIEELEAQLQSIRKRELETKQKLSDVENKYRLLKLDSDDQVRELNKTLTDIKEDTELITGQENAKIVRLNQRVQELEMKLETAENHAEAHRKLAVDLEKQLSVKNGLERTLEMKEQALQKAKLQIRELQYAKENFMEFQDQAKTQAYKITHYCEMQKENQQLKEENIRLKDEVRNKLLLEEEVYNLKNRVVKFKELEQKLSELHMQQIQTEMYLNEWRAVARGICETIGSDSSLPHLLRSVVERLQQQEIILTSEKVEIEAKLKTALHEAKVARAELDKNQKLLLELKTNSDQKQALIHRLQKKVLLISKERDSYRQQLDSYERDLTICLNTPTTPGDNSGQTQRDRIMNLERLVEDYRDMVNRLENDLHDAQPGLHSESVPVIAEQTKRLKAKIEQLEMDNNRLRSKNDELEIQLESYAIGNDSLRGGQVMHLAQNPLAECLAQREHMIENLEKETEKLKRKIKNLEEGIETSRLGDLSICPQELKTLRDKLQSQEAQSQYMKDYYKSSMQEFRNFIYMLLGYKIDRTQNGLYKLSSAYAEHEEDQLCFQVNKEGNLNLLETEFSRTLDHLMDLHLRQSKSIPVFMSALTLELFNSRTKTFDHV